MHRRQNTPRNLSVSLYANSRHSASTARTTSFSPTYYMPITYRPRPLVLVHDAREARWETARGLQHPRKSARSVTRMLILRVFPDQAVKSLCDTWHPDDIPIVFTACGRESLCAQPEPPTPTPLSEPSPSPPLMAAGFSKLFGTRNTQLPSPVSPTTRPSPSPPADGCESYTQAPESSGGSNLIPIKGFVHEVLRRSRTSTGVLQTALCYLEAVRAKVPELLRQEKADPTSDRHAEPEAEPRIVQGVFDDDSRDELADGSFTDAPEKTAGPTLDTIRVDDTYLANDTGADIPLPSVPAVARSKEPSPPLAPLPPLPSPLCCPRRTFLACLILASKFMQDRSYSNRAWAKLAGLPPREIGRCERAVGEALEWRLWVGKLPSTATTGSESSNSRVFSRTRSDGDLLAASTRTCSSASTAAWAASATAGMDAQRWTSSQTFASIPTPRATPRTTRTIRRSATVPAIASDAFAAPADPFLALRGRLDDIAACYDARPAPGQGYDPTFSMDVEPQVEVSPSLSTPTLSYSPMSTASSSSDGSEERTIQMSMFIDLPTPALSYASSATPSSCGPWVASSAMFPPADPANPYRAASHLNFNFSQTHYNNHVHSSYALESGMAENENAAFSATGRVFGVSTTKTAPPPTTMIPTTLPSFAEAFPLSEQCPGVLGFGSR